MAAPPPHRASPPRPAPLFDADFLRRLEALDVIARKMFAGLVRADRRSARKGSSAEFADHRPYAPGDDPRHVDWHLYGRLEEVFLKLYREEENLHLSVLLDVSQSMDTGEPRKLDFARQVAAALAYVGMSSMDAVNVLPFTARLHADADQGALWGLKGRGKVFRLFEALQGLACEGRTEMTPALREFVGRERRRGVVLVLSDFYDEGGFRAALKFLRHRQHQVFVVHVVDAGEEAPDLRGDLRLVDAETGAAREVNVTDGLLARYHAAFEAHARSVEAFCVQNEMGYVRARTDVPFDELVLGILRRGGLVG